MRYKRQKGYWQKKSETYVSGKEAKSRAGHLRTHEHVAHVMVEKQGDQYLVLYSVAKWYLDDLIRARIQL